jgi:hypothetical protein
VYSKNVAIVVTLVDAIHDCANPLNCLFRAARLIVRYCAVFDAIGLKIN